MTFIHILITLGFPMEIICMKTVKEVFMLKDMTGAWRDKILQRATMGPHTYNYMNRVLRVFRDN